ncbi:AAA family ATPase, partial [Desulfovibrio sp. OttesenSCG-928-G11]|nr:AAA family ATPase [Desulfovibrio sp. OttesenSCG-928-G11]
RSKRPKTILQGKEMAHLVINNFGPIKHFESSIARMNVLIGPQASGKSTVAKLLFYLKMFPIWLATYTPPTSGGRNNYELFQKILRTNFLNLFGPVYHQSDISISYSFVNPETKNEHTIKVSQSRSADFKNYLSIRFDHKLRLAVDNFLENIGDVKNQEAKGVIGSRTSRFYHEDVTQKRLMEDAKSIFAEIRSPIFIPAGRTLLTLLSGQINTGFKPSDFIMEEFLRTINDIRPQVGLGLAEVEELARRTWPQQPDAMRALLARHEIQTILRGQYSFADGEERIYHGSWHTKLSVASSGQQESLWVILVAYMLILERENVFAVFEEPEAHLYPESQYSIIRLLTLLANASQNNQILITTHSPYVLVSLNNLLTAHSYGKKNSDKVSEIIKRQFWLNANEIQAISFSEEGVGTSILDTELYMIKAEEIDSASYKMNEEYDRIIEISQ